MSADTQVDLLEQKRAAAELFVSDNLPALCQELVAFETTGLFGTGKAHELRMLCRFAGASAQPLALTMIHSAAVRALAATTTTGASHGQA